MSKKLSVEVWSDIACPWCYVGKRRLEQALARFPHRDAVEITWRAFQLDPSAPRVQDAAISYAQRLAKKYGRSEKQAQEMIDNMVKVAAADGLAFDFTHIRPGNTFDAHRLLHLAREQGLGDALKERLFAAYLEQGKAVGDPETLLSLASEVGLDADRAQALLQSDEYSDEVREEQQEARELGVSGVPFFVLGRTYAVSGAQPAELLLQALSRAWDDTPDLTNLESESGAVCGPDGCA
jgi:predicted DsbA family dithiol-disulfide isomerase